MSVYVSGPPWPCSSSFMCSNGAVWPCIGVRVLLQVMSAAPTTTAGCICAGICIGREPVVMYDPYGTGIHSSVCIPYSDHYYSCQRLYRAGMRQGMQYVMLSCSL